MSEAKEEIFLEINPVSLTDFFYLRNFSEKEKFTGILKDGIDVICPCGKETKITQIENGEFKIQEHEGSMKQYISPQTLLPNKFVKIKKIPLEEKKIPCICSGQPVIFDTVEGIYKIMAS